MNIVTSNKIGHLSIPVAIFGANTRAAVLHHLSQQSQRLECFVLLLNKAIMIVMTRGSQLSETNLRETNVSHPTSIRVVSNAAPGLSSIAFLTIFILTRGVKSMWSYPVIGEERAPSSFSFSFRSYKVCRDLPFNWDPKQKEDFPTKLLKITNSQDQLDIPAQNV